MAARIVESPAALKALIGQELGTSDWMLVDQAMIDRFAEVTGDHQWIHVDVARAAKEMPGGKTIAHGYLLLSLVPVLSRGCFQLAWPSRSLNYGSDKVRFIAPVPSGSRVRLRQELVSVEDAAPGAHRILLRGVLEVEGQERPAMIAETIRMTFA